MPTPQTNLSPNAGGGLSPCREIAEKLGGRSLVLFDGSCVMCNGTVLFLHRRDSLDRLRFAPIGGETYQRIAEVVPMISGIDSIVIARVESNGTTTVLLRSSAVLDALKTLGGFWATLAVIGAFVPRTLRDSVYQVIAKARYKLFGRHETCPLPPRDLAAKMFP